MRGRRGDGPSDITQAAWGKNLAAVPWGALQLNKVRLTDKQADLAEARANGAETGDHQGRPAAKSS